MYYHYCYKSCQCSVLSFEPDRRCITESCNVLIMTRIILSCQSHADSHKRDKLSSTMDGPNDKILLFELLKSSLNRLHLKPYRRN